MMSYIRVIDNKEFTYHHEIRAAYPDINFPEIITDDLLSQVGIQVKETEQDESIETTIVIEPEDV